MPHHHTDPAHGPDCPFPGMVVDLVRLYCDRMGVPPGELVTIHAEDGPDVFTLQIGIGRDGAAWLTLAQQMRTTGGM